MAWRARSRSRSGSLLRALDIVDFPVAYAHHVAGPPGAGTVNQVVCVLAGTVVGVLAALGNYISLRALSSLARREGRTVRISIVLLALLISVGWIACADKCGGWVAGIALHLNGRN